MSPELINNIATFAGILVAALGAFVFALWVAMGIWTFNDIRSRTRDWLAILLAVLLVMVFPIVGLILYTLIRPKTTLADVYDRALEEEALLRELEETHACPTCGVPARDNWVFCPNCHAQLQHTCPTCNNMVRNEWAICVFCGTPQRGGMPAPRVVQPELAGGVQPALGTAPLGAPTTAAGGALTASNAMRRAPRNPFAQQGALPVGTPATANSGTPLSGSPSTSGSVASGMTTGSSQPLPSASSTYAPPSYPPPAYTPPTYPASSTPDLDLEADDTLYRPTQGS